MAIRRGEILALLGENGSGKTTLMNMLSGIYYPDEGQILIDGKEVVIRAPKDAFELGIGMIHQHFKLVDVLSAAENIVLGMKGKLDLNGAIEKINAICDAYGFEVDPEAEDLRHVRVPEADGGDREGALPRRGHPDPGRAHRRADPPGDRQAVQRAAQHARRRQGHRHHHPQDARGGEPVRPRGGAARGRVHRRHDDRRDQRPGDDQHDGGPRRDPEHRPARARRSQAPAGGQGPDRAQRGRHPQAGRRVLHRQLRRDPGHRGHLRLRPEGAAGGHRGPAAHREPAASSTSRTTAPASSCWARTR